MGIPALRKILNTIVHNFLPVPFMVQIPLEGGMAEGKGHGAVVQGAPAIGIFVAAAWCPALSMVTRYRTSQTQEQPSRRSIYLVSLPCVLAVASTGRLGPG